MFGFSSTQAYLEKFGIHADLFRYLIVGGLIFTRFFIMTQFVPFWGGRPIPGRVRISLSVAFLIFFFGPVYEANTVPVPGGGILFVMFMKEILFGMLMGLSLSIIFYGIQSAGNMIDNQRQLANARIFNPALGGQSSLFGVFYYQFSLVIFLTLGGHRMFIAALARSFQFVPIMSLPPVMLHPADHPMIDLMIRLAANTLLVTLQLAAPVLVAIFIADLILGLTNRVAPMINVFEMGFNIKGFVGNLLAYLSIPLVFYQMKVFFLQALDNVEKLMRYFMK